MVSENVQRGNITAARIESAEIEIDLKRFDVAPVMLNTALRTVVLKFEDYWTLSGRQ